MDGWSLFVDIEGFSVIYKQDCGRALTLMCDLADGIYSIGSRVFSDGHSRLFAYGLGNGFLIVPGIEPAKPERPLAIAIALMHHLISRDGLLKAAISFGEIAHIVSFFSQPVKNGSMGEGLFTIFPVIGTALANAYKLSARVSGASVLLDARMAIGLPKEVRCSGSDPVRIDWLHSRWPLLDEVSKKSEIHILQPEKAEQHLLTYVEMEYKN